MSEKESSENLHATDPHLARATEMMPQEVVGDEVAKKLLTKLLKLSEKEHPEVAELKRLDQEYRLTLNGYYEALVNHEAELAPVLLAQAQTELKKIRQLALEIEANPKLHAENSELNAIMDATDGKPMN